MNFFKGFVPTSQKKCLVPFKDKSSAELYKYEDAKKLHEFAGILQDDAILIDFDDSKQADIAFKIIETLEIRCRVLETTRGIHCYFKNNQIKKGGTKLKLACGLEADIKVGSKNSYSILKFNGQDRDIIYDKFDNEDYQLLPKWLYPVSSNIDFFNMEAGDGRNSALFGYILNLTSAGFSKDESRECIQIINKYILQEPLDDNEIETILRDDAFPEDLFFDGKAFKPHVFGQFIMNNYKIIKINNRLHTYSDGIYSPELAKISKQMRNTVPSIKKHHKAEVYDYLEDVAESCKQSSENLIAFNNGVLNLVTRELLPHSPEFVITNKINWDYNPDAHSEIADKTLNKIACDSSEIRSLLEEALGYCFYRSNRFQKAFIMTGEKSNGKSTYLKILQEILGINNTSAMDLNSLGDRFNTAMLFGKLANLGDDISDDFIQGLQVAIFKKIVTGDRVKAEFKGETPFEFNPYAKLLFSANNIPNTRDKTGAVARRLVIIPFNAKFSPSDPDYDPYIEDKLKTPDSIEYFIRLGIEGLQRVIRNKQFTKCKEAEQELKDYDLQNNPTKAFLLEQSRDYILREPVPGIYRDYQIYCLENGHYAESQVKFGRTCGQMFRVKSCVSSQDGQKLRMYKEI